MTVTSGLHILQERNNDGLERELLCREKGGLIVRERERRWVLLKIPRCDLDGVGEGKCP